MAITPRCSSLLEKEREKEDFESTNPVAMLNANGRFSTTTIAPGNTSRGVHCNLHTSGKRRPNFHTRVFLTIEIHVQSSNGCTKTRNIQSPGARNFG